MRVKGGQLEKITPFAVGQIRQMPSFRADQGYYLVRGLDKKIVVIIPLPSGEDTDWGADEGYESDRLVSKLELGLKGIKWWT